MSNLETALAADVQRYERATKDRIEAALDAGQKLTLAKKDCKHGEWLPLLDRVGLTARTAQRWMTLARALEDGKIKCDTVTHLGLRKTCYLLAHEEGYRRAYRAIEFINSLAVDTAMLWTAPLLEYGDGDKAERFTLFGVIVTSEHFAKHGDGMSDWAKWLAYIRVGEMAPEWAEEWAAATAC